MRAQICGALAALPAHLRHHLLATVVKSRPRHADDDLPIHTLLACLPESSHQAVLVAAISPEKRLRAKLSSHSHRLHLINALRSLSPAIQQIKSLEIHRDGCSWSGDSRMKAAEELAQSIQQHTKLTRLRLGDPCISSDVLSTLAPALFLLTDLKSFHIHGDEDAIPADSIATVSSVLRCMPHLEDLEISLQPSETSKRQRDTDVPAKRLALPLTILSIVSGLTSLCIRMTSIPAAVDPTMQNPALFFPQLQHLHVTFADCEWAQGFVSKVAAPLTKLQFNEARDEPRPDTITEHASIAGSVVPSIDMFQVLNNFPELRELSLGPWPVHGDTGLNRSLLAMLNKQQPVTALQDLHWLQLIADQILLEQAAPLLSATFPYLTSMDIDATTCRVQSNRRSPHSSEEWDIMFRHFHTMNLKKMHFATCSLIDRQHGPAFSSLCFVTSLTSLVLVEHDAWKGERDLAALVQATQLLHLTLCFLYLPTSAAEPKGRALLPCLAALTSLTCLAVGGALVPHAFAQFAQAGQLQISWPSLQSLHILKIELWDLVSREGLQTIMQVCHHYAANVQIRLIVCTTVPSGKVMLPASSSMHFMCVHIPRNTDIV